MTPTDDQPLYIRHRRRFVAAAKRAAKNARKDGLVAAVAAQRIVAAVVADNRLLCKWHFALEDAGITEIGAAVAEAKRLEGAQP